MLCEENLEHFIHELATLEKLDNVEVPVELVLALLKEEIQPMLSVAEPLIAIFVLERMGAAEPEGEEVFKGLPNRILEVAPVHDCLEDPIQLLSLRLFADRRI